jgi:hypothetical protein
MARWTMPPNYMSTPYGKSFPLSGRDLLTGRRALNQEVPLLLFDGFEFFSHFDLIYLSKLL